MSSFADFSVKARRSQNDTGIWRRGTFATSILVLSVLGSRTHSPRPIKVKTKHLSLKAKAKNIIDVIVVHRSNAMFIHISIANVLCTASRRAQFKASNLQRAL